MAERIHGCWWTSPKQTVHHEVKSWVSYVGTQQRGLREDTVFYLNLASNFNVSGNGVEGYQAFIRNRTGKMRYNLCSAGVETAGSLIAQNRTAPIITTINGDFTLARKAEQRSRVLQSQFYSLGAWDLGADVFFDAAITGTGAVFGYVDPDTGMPKLERVLPNELFVDDFDGITGNPRTIARVKFPAREVMRGLYPKFDRELEKSSGPGESDWTDFFLRRDNKSDRVKVYEIWHLPSVVGGKDGRHVICTDNVTLIDEPLRKPRFPFAIYRYVKRRFGFFGQGLVERLTPSQIRMSELAQVEKDCQDLCSTAIIAVEENSNVEWEDLSNLPGQVLKYQGRAPELLNWSGTPLDLVQAYERIKQEAFDAEGLSQQMVGGEKPAGLASARAVRAADDVMSRRHIQPTRMFERFYLDLATLIADLNDEAAELDDSYTVVGRTRTGLKTFLTTSRWKDLALPEGNVEVTMFPMAALPTTIQAKFAAVEEWIQGGFVSKPQALDLMEFPDTEAFTDLTNASLDLTKWQIERLLDSHPELPIPNQDLAMAQQLVNQAFLVAYRMQAGEEILAAFQDYLDYAKKLAEEQAPPPPPDAAQQDPNAAPPAPAPMAA